MRQPQPEKFDPKYTKASVNPKPEPIELDGVTPIKPHQRPDKRDKKEEEATAAVKSDDTMIPRHHDTSDGIMTPRYHDTIEAVRKAVKEVGKEAATHRFTASEKQHLAEIIFTYRQRGIKTSENELARIAINYLVEEFHQEGDASVLAQVLEKLNT